MELTKTEYESIIRDHQRVIDILQKKSDDEPWYFRFDHYAESENFFNEYKYDPRIDKYFHYNEGVFHEYCREELDTLFNDWGDFFNERMNNSKISFLRRRYTGKIMFKDQWDPDPNIDNCLNGLVFKAERELRPHSPDYPSRYQIQRNYLGDTITTPPELFHQMLKIIKDVDERRSFMQFITNVVHQFYDDELFCMFYGPRNGGKSTLMLLFESLFGSEIVSKTGLQTIGSKFGYEDLYDKRINVNPDLPTIDLAEFTIAAVKLLTGNDGMIPVNVKKVKGFSYIIKCFLVFGINQLMGFNVKSEKEMESIFRRVLLVEVPDKLPSDPAFKKATQDPEFLDELYTWLVFDRPRSIIQEVEITAEDIKQERTAIDVWIQKQKKKWLENSNPIMTILTELFYYDDGMELPVNHVQEKVLELLDSEDSIITSKAFKTNVTQALSALRIYPNGKRGINAKYINIAEVI